MDFKKIEQKWQKGWEDGNIFQATENPKKKKFYVLDMFPYPSGEGLHIGHAFVFSLGDIFARFKRLQGFNVLYPIGYDSLGLPAENAAIKVGVHPEEYTKKSIANFMKQQKAMGWSYDWSRQINTCDSDYYKWDQWIFLKMLEKGIAYRKKAPVNWCPECQTVLANEQVVGGKCWRHEDTGIEIKHLEQWFLKITDYAEELLNGLEKIDWPDNAKKLQKNWIGKSHGVEIDFEINGRKWPMFTTRPDTIYGVTFMVISAQHPKLMELVTKKQEKEVKKFLKKIKTVSEKEKGELEKEGVFTGCYAVNPLTKDKIPVYAGNFVVADYGSGMVMAVPAHDQRDFEFAKKYNVPIKVVINPHQHPLNARKMVRAFTADGVLVNSGDFTGSQNKDAIEEITEYLKKKKLGKKVIQYKLRDWLISRQRYWGTPIPIVYCDKCGLVPVPEKDLPVKLPKKVTFGKGNPLATNKNFVNTKCPKCGGMAKRETDTMDTFVNSSWYYLRYADPNNNKKIFDNKKTNYWAPIDQYIGGPEHITAHLIYIRFYTKFLRDIGLLRFNEPALKYFTQGIVHGDDGEKMSKSRGNVVEPLNMIKKYGADTLRLYLVSNASPDKDFEWNDNGIQGSFKFVNKIYEYFSHVKTGKSNKLMKSKYNKAVKEITLDIENFRHNLAVIKLRGLFEKLEEKENKEVLEGFLKLLHPFCPYITEELWERLGNKQFISLQKWPEYDEKKIDIKLEKQEDLVKQTISDIIEIQKLVRKKPKEINIFVSPKWKYDAVKIAIKNKDKTDKIIPEIMKIKDAKKEGKFAAQFAQKLIKNIHQLGEPLPQKDELKALKESEKSLKEEFKCKINIIKSEKSKSEKAKRAEPGKPGIEIIA